MKKTLALFLSVVLLCSCITGTANATADHSKVPTSFAPYFQLSSQEDAVTYYLSQSDEDSFGGIYYDDDGILVVNTVGTLPGLALYSQNSQAIGVRYQEVTHSLRDLEAVKDFLTGYMDEYSIVVLDANEVTNQVDVSLKSYTEENMKDIRSLVQSQFPDMDCLYFEDYSNYTVSFTVGDKPSTKTSVELSETHALPPTTETTVVLGTEIKIGNYYYTLGPAISSTTAYSAGHGFKGQQHVAAFVSFQNPLGIDIGTASPSFGGIAGDTSTITAGFRIKFGLVTQSATPVAGKKVKMIGAVSSGQTGTILKTNQTITVDAEGDTPKTTLMGMCSANYKCAKGDSGAGVFDANQPSVYHCGVQSSAVFDDNKNWIGPSYFTPL